MNRIVCVVIFLVAAAGAVSAEEANPPVTFGMQFEADYAVLTGAFNVWNLRYGLGIDFLVHLGSSYYLGLELSTLFGFHKENLDDPSFDRVYAQFPLHLSLTAYFSGFNAQLYAGVSYAGEAALSGGMVYVEDFAFRLLPDAGFKLGWGTVNHLFIKAGYLFEDHFYFGLGARLGLF